MRANGRAILAALLLAAAGAGAWWVLRERRFNAEGTASPEDTLDLTLAETIR